MYWRTFWLSYGAFQLLVILMGVLNWKEGYFIDTASQALLRGRSGNVGFLVKHGGWWGDLLWISPALAVIVARYGERFDSRVLAILIVIAGLASVPLLRQWMAEGIVVPSGLARDGYLTIAGGVHYLYMVLAFALIVQFYITPGVLPRDVWIVTLLLMGHVALGVLQPIYVSTGNIPLGTWTIFASGWGALLILAGVRTMLF